MNERIERLVKAARSGDIFPECVKVEYDKYKSIRVRVSGFSATFVNLEDALQDNVIARTVNHV